MTIEQGQLAPFPDLVFTDADGTEWDVRKVLEKGPLLVGIYKSSCASSKQMFPILERLHQRYGDAGLQVLGISQDSPNITKSFARRYDLTFPLLVEGEEYPISSAFEIMATPSVFLIQPDGFISYMTMGFLKPGLDALGEAAADAVNQSHSPLITDADADLPMFVPG
ncbi:MAG: TlpA disulfide reductase family protein [Thermomicrobiales bacterium]